MHPSPICVHIPDAWLVQEYLKVEERREELKQQIALAAMRLLQDPEQHLRDLTSLVDLARGRDELVRNTWLYANTCM